MRAARTPFAGALLVGALLGAVTFLGACGAARTQIRPPPAPPRTAPSPGPSSGPAGASAPAGGPPEGTCTRRARSVCVTSSANGRTIAVGVGWTVEVDLSSPDGIWSAPVEAGPRLLRQLGQARRAGGGVRVAYRSASAGRTALRAFERPLCRPGRVCPQYILAWELNIRVSRALS